VAELLIFGAGYTGLAIAREAVRCGISVAITSRGTPAMPPGVTCVAFEDAAPAIAEARFLLSTAAPDGDRDPVLARWGNEIAAAPAVWRGYLSATGVYGNHDGGWVDEDTPPRTESPRAARRIAAELAWEAYAAGRPLDIIRLAGIYGPGRSALDEVRAGRARRVVKPGHAFGRIHRDDIAAGVLAAIAHPPAATRILNFNDDEPAESAVVLTEAARLLGRKAPPEVNFETAWRGMSDMARRFWADNRRVRADKTKAALELAWSYPTYREGLAAILAQETGHRAKKKRDIRPA
jgi:nucleoside-diphosphate-sugar epimerase